MKGLCERCSHATEQDKATRHVEFTQRDGMMGPDLVMGNLQYCVRKYFSYQVGQSWTVGRYLIFNDSSSLRVIDQQVLLTKSTAPDHISLRIRTVAKLGTHSTPTGLYLSFAHRKRSVLRLLIS